MQQLIKISPKVQTESVAPWSYDRRSAPLRIAPVSSICTGTKSIRSALPVHELPLARTK
ncbi:hypothetical protein ACSX1A_10690 [Pontibacter sp. MBLB2868]|uniref:hypothetical protein n=1 Tax=Pontibacter sp. MBLB2868 TaxID=3451555 RepID=UPI003F7544FA